MVEKATKIIKTAKWGKSHQKKIFKKLKNTIKLPIHNQQTFFSLQCRDEGPLRARVQWFRGGDLPFPAATQDVNGRLEMPSVLVSMTWPLFQKAGPF